MEINNGNKLEAITDVPILLMFFVRPEKLKYSFEAVKKARPKQLFLVSDGPRENYPNDKKLNEKCKQIVEDINWECEVHYKYANKNKGMHYIGMNAFKWAFEHVDRLIFLEDDVVPNQSFFPFCENLLERYKDDLRVHTICGMNHTGIYDKPDSDYFFSKRGSIWGFALWKRSFELFDFTFSYYNSTYYMNLLLNSFDKGDRKNIENKIILQKKRWEENKELAPFELLNGASFFLNNCLMIIPKKNMINCMGISENSGHNVNNPQKLPKAIRRLFNMETHELIFPIKHPSFVVEDVNYGKLVRKYMGKNKLTRFVRKVEGFFRRIFFRIVLRK